MLKKLSLFMVVCILAMSFTVATVSVQAQEAVNGRAYILSFDDGSYSQLLGGEGMAHAVVTDEISETEGGKSLCWTKDNNDVTFLFPNKGVENMSGKKTLNFRVYSKPVDSSATSRFNIVVYNRVGEGSYQWQHYPITGEGWATVSIDFKNLGFWSDSAPAAVKFEARANYTKGDKLYIDSAWVEYAAPTTYTEKNDEGSKTVLDFNTITAKGSHDINSNKGISWGYTADTDFDSANSLYFNVSGSDHTTASALFIRCLNSTTDAHYHEQMNWNEYDNVVFRMKALRKDDASLTSGLVYITFSSGYATRLNDDRKYIGAASVSFDEWQDYKIQLSEFSNFPDNIRSIVITSQKTATSDFGIVIDSIFLTKDAPKTLAEPAVDVFGNNVNTYLAGNNTVNFVFDENLSSANFAQGVKVFKNSSVSNEAFVTNVNGNTLSVTFADALAPESDYTIILDKNYIKGANGNVMAEDAVCSFTTGKADYSVESIEIVKGENSVSANAKISNNTSELETLTLFIAAYSGNKLEYVVPAKITLHAVAGGIKTATIEDIEDVNAYTYKAFVWDSVAGLVPVPVGK